jgi:g-D-glutamyl-meso-diaminopimelate peptidase
MKILRLGSAGPSVQLLQLALTRAGFGPLALDGAFGRATQSALKRFQTAAGLTPDGAAGAATHTALRPYYTGYLVHIVRPGDTLWSIARARGAELTAVETANPGLAAPDLRPGDRVTVPLPFAVVPTDIDYASPLVDFCAEGLAARYPFIQKGVLGKSVMGKPLWYLRLGEGENRVFYNASHHANEWITTPVLLKFAEELAAAYAAGGTVYGQDVRRLLAASSIYIAPAVNPDGIDLVTGELDSGPYYAAAERLAAGYPRTPFPSGWKANIAGTDLNLQYPAGWEQAKKNKYALGFTGPGPTDYVGPAPLSAPESRAMYDFTLSLAPALTLSYHTQGRVIYWKFLDFEPKNSRRIAETFAAVSGYAAEETPYASGFAGYKDWFIQQFDRPGYTIECGLGTNPLPVADFAKIYSDNLGILTLGAAVTA